MRGAAALVVTVAAASLLALSPRSGASQVRTVRFEITAVGDSTVSFRVGRASWVLRAPSAIAVDPRQRDALIARLRVLSVSTNGEATALITGQTGRLTTDHIAIVTEPRSRWFRSRGFWAGTILGLAAGFGLGRI